MPSFAEARVQTDSARRDILYCTPEADIFRLANDGKTDEIRWFEDGVDRIDLSAIDATFDQLMIKQLGPREYVVDYQGEERIRVSFNFIPLDEFPVSGFLLTAEDFIFRDGLPDATRQVIFDRIDDGPETLYSTTSPDTFVLTDDGQKDVIRKFEPGKDLIDLADYGVSFGDLRIREEREGRIVINVPGDGQRDKIVLIDVSRRLTEEDITADMFIF